MTFLFKRPLSPTRVWTCVLTNLAATPGLGSLMARRFFAGTGQLLLALAGFFLIVGWIFKVIYQAFQEPSAGMTSGASSGWMLKWGAIFFGAGWLWALVTSVSLIREAKMDERKKPKNIPPKLAVLPAVNSGGK